MSAGRVGGIRIASIEEAVRRAAAAEAADGAFEPAGPRAAVAVVLREWAARAGPEAEVLVIGRAERAGDPWSGHAALPGGRMEERDRSPEETAVRETREEVGLDLLASGARLIGRLPNFAPRRSRWLSVTPVLFEVRGDPPLAPDSREVARTLWAPLAALASGAHETQRLFWWRPFRRVPVPLPMVLPCWRYEGLEIWGLTYRILSEILRLAGARR